MSHGKYLVPALFRVLAVLLILLAGGPVLASATPDPCGLFTKTDAESLFKEPLSDGKPREVSLPAGMSCRYTFSKGGSVYGVTVRLATSDSIEKEGIHDSAKDVFSRMVKAQRLNEKAAKKL